ncbi:acetylcholinesterase-like isoform X2 [Haliotis rubra]|uniref:acetylcholinesterase-like isoform X2 n=1 Tax=Haliotis rubra TaxID=36100 RepID=UPI001EE5B74A|nr:acetylcholinesterase-like isoform X2 [Haliotis rubra]
MQILLYTLVSFLLSITQLASGQEVDTTHGKVVGLRSTVLGKTIHTYYGIPYARPPIGDLRFKYPQPMDSWSPEVKEARSMKPSCLQTVQPSPGMPWRAVPSNFSEDCLYINVWAPANVTTSRKLTTMVWIFGGGYQSGSMNTPLYHGQYLAAENNVIVMSMNYRLGALGFLYLGPDTFPGNQGLMDQALALQWIQNNVGRFGGDASMITLFGESAGAASVGLHLLSPISRNFFTRAILQSGAPDAPWGFTTAPKAMGSTRRLAELSNCSAYSHADIFQCIRVLPPETVIQTQALVPIDGSAQFSPVVDGHFLPDSPASLIEKGQMKQVEILLGVNKNEGVGMLMGILPTIFTPFTDQLNVNRTQFLTTVKALTSVQPSAIFKAISAQYADIYVPSLHPNYLDSADGVLGDNFFKCPATKLAASHSANNNVYLYSFEYRIPSLPLPQWMGVAHTFEIESVFGHPLGDAFTSTDVDKSISRSMMTYWTNFAKTGNPNLPETPNYQWPTYNWMDERFLVFSSSGLSTEQGMRKPQCVFWNTLVPLIQKNKATSTGSTTEVYRCHTSGSRMSFTVNTCLVAVLAALVSV